MPPVVSLSKESPMKTRRTMLRNENGFALFAVFLLVILFLSMGTAGLVSSALDFKSTNHYRTGNQALATAEAAVLHALNVMNTRSVRDLKEQAAELGWSDAKGFFAVPDGGGESPCDTPGAVNGACLLQGNARYQYWANVTADPDPQWSASQGTITAIGVGTEDAGRVLRVKVRKSDLAGALSAVYIAHPDPDPIFNGNSFLITGNDVDLNGNSTGWIAPAITTQNDGAGDAVKGALSTDQVDNIIGLGDNPSIMPTGGPTPDDFEDIASAIFNSDPPPDNAQVFEGETDLKFVDVGTNSKPAMIWVKGDCTLNGGQEGYGFIYCAGSCKLNGTAAWTGWMMCRDGTIVEAGPGGGVGGDKEMMNGTFEMTGMIWTGRLDPKVGGNFTGNFSFAAVATYANGAFQKFPRKMSVMAWQEIGYGDLTDEVRSTIAGPMLGKDL